MSPLITLLGVITAVAFAVAPELVSIDPQVSRYVMLAGVAAAAAGRALDPRRLRVGFPRRGTFASRRTLKAVAVVALAGLLFTSAACQTESVRGVSAGVSVGAVVLRDEIAAGVRAGDYTQAEADFLNPVIDEIESAAAAVRDRAASWDSMTKVERRALALEAVAHIGAAVERLSAKGVGVKSERGRRKLDAYLRKGRLAVGVLQTIEAALPRQS